MKATLFILLWIFHFLTSAFFLLCEIELPDGVASEFNEALMTEQKFGHIAFEIFGFPLLSFFWCNALFEGTRIYVLVMANSFLWTVAVLCLSNFLHRKFIEHQTATS